MECLKQNGVHSSDHKPEGDPAFQQYSEQAMKLKHNFRHPLLRKFPGDPAGISWQCRLGGGVDGYVWEVKYSNQGPFALELWENEPPPAAAEQTTESSPYVHAEPATHGRREQRLRTVSGSLSVASIPRLRDCFGWSRISGQFLRDLEYKGMAPPSLDFKEVGREIQPDQEYFAIVYGSILEGDNDLSEIVFPRHSGWNIFYGRREAERQLGDRAAKHVDSAMTNPTT
ncbi:hypothetical protein GGS23DRAFT_607749 [Durotheca rogersii]|uniref:uncharacterized protein n=1 Tax=Durotheca rogersii TaxID=419775 RepID=UPI002220AB5B|nr:uncharacterized protein GGS23DRAFT_607749 [Durotheca rogersii]KAI5858238.1 hypothetical protein GGS23DRAFT_607749 [Durotheca rogersii]